MFGLIILVLVTAVCAEDFGYNYQPLAASDNELFYIKNNEFNYHLKPSLQQTVAETPVAEPAILTSEFQKEFYSFTAPEDALEDDDIDAKIASSFNKNLRVVFIKAPENKGFEQAAIALAKQAAEQRTAIYVLAKQNDIGTLAQQLQNIRSQSQSKPDVHFIKYRTNEDAINAQKLIKEQYNNVLPGSSHSVEGGQVPVLNFASRAPSGPGYVPPGPGHQYLPANPIPSSELRHKQKK